MPANSFNAKAFTDYLVALLTAKLVPETPPRIAQQVIDYWNSNLNGQVSSVMVLYAGEDPQMRHVNSGTLDTWVYAEVQIWVLYRAMEGWSLSDAEDKRAEIKKYVKDVIVDNRGKALNPNAPWEMLTFNGQSQAENVLDASGVPYLIEHVPVKMHKAHG